LASFWPLLVQATGAAVTVQANDALAVWPAESRAVAVTLFVAAVVGVPETTPVEALIVSPAGRPVALQV